MKTKINIVWYKRDLRIYDHLPLSKAVEVALPVLPVYVVEPHYWQQPFASRRHWSFIHDCLVDLRQDTKDLGQPLIVTIGEICEVLDALNKQYYIDKIFSHQECGNNWTYERDKSVVTWCRENQVTLNEFPHNGVVRGMESRDDWSKLRNSRMAQPLVEPPKMLKPIRNHPIGEIPSTSDPLFGSQLQGKVQAGGRREALKLLNSFLHTRSVKYLNHISKPGDSEHYCSRLSTHLTWGSLSVREVVKATESFKHSEFFGRKGLDKRSFSAFSSRLSWRCHFIQKLEDQPEIEFECMHSAYDGIRDECNDKFYEAWAQGVTGYPLVDACMRSLNHNGWITFRMRAMLVSFASYHLWLDWRKTGYHLAKLFTDYEPGIHYSQLQMQSGVTGINAVRIYNPVKQSQEQDPEGKFIRQWVPELAGVKNAWIHQPWLMNSSLQITSKCIIGSDYPEPIVHHASAVAAAHQKLSLARQQEGYRKESSEVFSKLGSRTRTSGRKEARTDRNQMSLFS